MTYKGNCIGNSESRTITFSNFLTNDVALQNGIVSCSLFLAGFKNPNSEKPTSTFALNLLDSKGFLMSYYN